MSSNSPSLPQPDITKLYVVLEFVFSGSKAQTVYFNNIEYLSDPKPTTPTPTLTPTTTPTNTPSPSPSQTPTATVPPTATPTNVPSQTVNPNGKSNRLTNYPGIDNRTCAINDSGNSANNHRCIKEKEELTQSE